MESPLRVDSRQVDWDRRVESSVSSLKSFPSLLRSDPSFGSGNKQIKDTDESTKTTSLIIKTVW